MTKRHDHDLKPYAKMFLDLLTERAAQGNEVSLSLMRKIAVMQRANGAHDLADATEARLAQILRRAH